MNGNTHQAKPCGSGSGLVLELSGSSAGSGFTSIREKRNEEEPPDHGRHVAPCLLKPHRNIIFGLTVAVLSLSPQSHYENSSNYHAL